MKGGMFSFLGINESYETLLNKKAKFENEIKDLIDKFNELQEVLRKDQTVKDPETIIVAIENEQQRDLSDDEKDKFRNDPRYKKLSESEIEDINTKIQGIQTNINEKNKILIKVNNQIKEKKIKQQKRDAEKAQGAFISSIEYREERKQNDENLEKFVEEHGRKPFASVLDEREEKIVKNAQQEYKENQRQMQKNMKNLWGGRRHRKSTKKGLRKRVHHTRRNRKHSYKKRSMHKHKHHRRSHRTHRTHRR